MENNNDFNEILDGLDALSVSDEIKNSIKQDALLLQVAKKRRELGLKVSTGCNHYVFVGNKCKEMKAVAEILAKLYHNFGHIQKGHLVVAEKGDLIDLNIGRSFLKTRDVCESAVGGALLIYDIDKIKNGENDFVGDGALNAILNTLKGYYNEFTVIITAEKDRFQNFLNCNPGFQVRFTRFIEFN